MSNVVKTVTPHAAVLIWNFVDRLGAVPTSKNDDVVNRVEKKIISTLSLISINTTKMKSAPTGRFEFTLAPTKNWVSTITAGSWCCILMSQKPITKDDFDSVDPEKLKMIGKIEGVRQQVNVNPETGARSTTYIATGMDWGHVFENNVYIDPFIDKKNNTVGAATYLEIFPKIVNKNGIPLIPNTASNLESILQIMGQPLDKNFSNAGSEINQVASADFKFLIPNDLAKYLGFSVGKNKQKNNSITDYIKMYHGKLTAEDTYKNIKESVGMIDPTSFTGISSMWQILTDNSNPTMNEMLCDLKFDKGKVVFALWNRIKPFSYRSAGVTKRKIRKALQAESVGVSKKEEGRERDRLATSAENMISPFKLVRTVKIDVDDVRYIDSGTNWRDKFNFVEVKPAISFATQLSSYIKTTSQLADVGAFKREGFRPLIFQTKQLPSKTFEIKKSAGGGADTLTFDVNGLIYWKYLLKEWYFDTHKLLNGTMTITGQNEHIMVGDNIMVGGKVLGLTPNINAGTLKNSNFYLLAQVENVQHNFTVDANGSRSFITTINFIRGVITDESKSIINEGSLDSLANQISAADNRNTTNVIGTSSQADPDVKVRGT